MSQNNNNLEPNAFKKKYFISNHKLKEENHENTNHSYKLYFTNVFPP